MTCAPYENKDDATIDELWEFCYNNFQKRFLLATYSKSATTVEEENALGILAGHAYAILDIQEVLNRSNQKARIL